eukprot:g34791.t1
MSSSVSLQLSLRIRPTKSRLSLNGGVTKLTDSVISSYSRKKANLIKYLSELDVAVTFKGAGQPWFLK